MALFCRVLYAQCALKVYEHFHRKQQQRARLHAGRDRPPGSAGAAVQSATTDARTSRHPSDSKRAAMPGRTRHARSSSAGGVGGTDHAFHDAVWAVFDVLVSHRRIRSLCPSRLCSSLRSCVLGFGNIIHVARSPFLLSSSSSSSLLFVDFLCRIFPRA